MGQLCMPSHFTPSVKTAKLVGNPVPKESLMSDFLTDIKTLRKRGDLVNLLKKPGS